MAAFMNTLLAFRSGAKLFLMYKWDPERASTLINKFGITRFSGTPAMTGDLVRIAKTIPMPSLAVVGGGGSARSPSQVKEIDEVTKSKPTIGWGMTETQAVGKLVFSKFFFPVYCFLKDLLTMALAICKILRAVGQ